MIEANQSNRRFETHRRDSAESTGGRQSHQFLQVESPPTNEHGDRVFPPGVEIVLGRTVKSQSLSVTDVANGAITPTIAMKTKLVMGHNFSCADIASHKLRLRFNPLGI